MPIIKNRQTIEVDKIDPTTIDCNDDAYIHVWTDGGGNRGPISMGVIIVDEGQIVMTHGEFISSDATNNIAELTAILRGLQLGRHYNKPIKLYSDSQYSLNSVAGIYRGPKNRVLIDTIQEFILTLKYPIEFIQVKGHSLLPYNEYADFIASWFLRENKKRDKGTARQKSTVGGKKKKKKKKKSGLGY